MGEVMIRIRIRLEVLPEVLGTVLGECHMVSGLRLVLMP